MNILINTIGKGAFIMLISFIFHGCSNDDPAVNSINIGFDKPSLSALEGDTINILVSTDQPLINDLYLELHLSGGAKEYEDYKLNSNSMLLKAGQLSEAIKCILVTDNKVEVDETVFFSIVNVQSTDNIHLVNTKCDLTIKDNDNPAILEFAEGSSYVYAHNPTIKIVELRFDRFIKDEVEIEINLGGDASVGEDYDIITPQAFAVGDGIKSVYLEFYIYQNSDGETDEKILITAEVLSGSDAAPGQLLSHELTIFSNKGIAGIYEVTQAAYYRIGEEMDVDNWVGQERIISQFDDSRFSYNDYWGPFEWKGEHFNFSIEPATNKITVPITNTLFAGDFVLNCADNYEHFINVPCDESNIFVEDQVNGQHKIYLTYGYYFDTDEDDAGPREYYEVLERIIN